MSYACGPADWIDLAIGRLEDAKRSLRECDRLRQGCDICEELRQARRCLNKALIMVAEEKEIVKAMPCKKASAAGIRFAPTSPPEVCVAATWTKKESASSLMPTSVRTGWSATSGDVSNVYARVMANELLFLRWIPHRVHSLCARPRRP